MFGMGDCKETACYSTLVIVNRNDVLLPLLYRVIPRVERATMRGLYGLSAQTPRFQASLRRSLIAKGFASDIRYS